MCVMKGSVEFFTSVVSRSTEEVFCKVFLILAKFLTFGVDTGYST